MKVYRFSNGSFFECQDFWRLSGIERDVVLYSKPKLNVFDYEVHAGLDNAYKNGTFEITLKLQSSTEKIMKNASISVSVHRDAGGDVFGQTWYTIKKDLKGVTFNLAEDGYYYANVNLSPDE